MDGYQKQALDFLVTTNTEFKAKLISVCPNEWTLGLIGLKYKIKLSRGQRTLSFFWYGSHKDAEAYQATGATPENLEYQVLASLGISGASNFCDFCDMFGYDTDCRRSLATWKEVKTMDEKLTSFFSEEELDLLSEIN